ncbi:MAG: hypothetical protein QNJ90_09395 [Planctomycetota bacterium]|nr:hypothetical protein [Planctomycetota bacterium]
MSAEPQSTSAGRSRAMRGALLFVILGAAVGAAMGWTTGTVRHRAEAVLRLKPSRPVPQEPGVYPGYPPRLEGLVAFHAELLRSRRLALHAMKTDAWRATGERHEAQDAVAFTERREVLHEPTSLDITVRFSDLNPETALAGLEALLVAYRELVADLDETRPRYEYAIQQMEKLNRSMQEAEALIRTLPDGGPEREKERERAARLRRENDELLALAEILEERAARGTPAIAKAPTLDDEPVDDMRPSAALRGAGFGALPGCVLMLVLALGRRRESA